MYVKLDDLFAPIHYFIKIKNSGTNERIIWGGGGGGMRVRFHTCAKVIHPKPTSFLNLIHVKTCDIKKVFKLPAHYNHYRSDAFMFYSAQNPFYYLLELSWFVFFLTFFLTLRSFFMVMLIDSSQVIHVQVTQWVALQITKHTIISVMRDG